MAASVTDKIPDYPSVVQQGDRWSKILLIVLGLFVTQSLMFLGGGIWAVDRINEAEQNEQGYDDCVNSFELRNNIIINEVLLSAMAGDRERRAAAGKALEANQANLEAIGTLSDPCLREK